MRVLVTGASGFVGRAVVAQLRSQGLDVITVGRKSPGADGSLASRVLESVGDAGEVRRMLEAVEPHVLMHLAGTTSLANYVDLYAANVAFAANLLDGAAAMASPPRVLVVGSAAEYGPVPEDRLPVREDHPCRPAGAYGISKLAQTGHALAARARGLSVVVARLFNPIGAAMPATLALGSFAHQIAQAKKVGGGTLTTGDLDVVRDFIDVEEAARLLACLTLATREPPDIVNVCTGSGQSLLTLTRRMIELSGVAMNIESNPARRGNSDVRVFVGDPSRLRDSGFFPAPLDIDLSLKHILEGVGV